MFAVEPPPTDTNATAPATTPKPEDVRGMVKNQDFIVWSVVFAGVLILAAVVFVFFDRWRKKPTGESTRDVSLSLNSFKEMYENGELTEAEYERIKAKWAAKIKEKTGTPASQAAPPAQPPDPVLPPVPPAPPPST